MSHDGAAAGGTGHLGHGAGERLTGAEAHLADILALIRPVEPAWVRLEDAEGGVLAEDVLTRSALPPFDNSAMDGYAVHASDLRGASAQHPVSLPVRAEIAAGDTATYRVGAGSCVRIMTGALLPGGADAVVPVELTDSGAAVARFHHEVPAGNAIRRRGDDIHEGALLLEAGCIVDGVKEGLLAAAGHDSVLVRIRPRVVVVSTGNELAAPGTPLVPGQIWESNSYLLAAAARQAGAVAQRHHLPDNPSLVLNAITALLPHADLVLTSGGVSMGGEHDVVKAALAELGSVTFRKVAIQPGMPQGFGVLGPQRTPILTLPGNPVSAYVSFLLFGRPVLDALCGRPPRPPRMVTAALLDAVRSPAGRRSYLRGVLDAAEQTVRPLTGQSSHQLGSMAAANALIVVPEQVTRLEAGDGADVMCLP